VIARMLGFNRSSKGPLQTHRRFARSSVVGYFRPRPSQAPRPDAVDRRHFSKPSAELVSQGGQRTRPTVAENETHDARR
jgi:hypothetical protein